MGLNCRQYQELLVKDSKTNKEAEKTRVMLEVCVIGFYTILR